MINDTEKRLFDVEITKENESINIELVYLYFSGKSTKPSIGKETYKTSIDGAVDMMNLLKEVTKK